MTALHERMTSAIQHTLAVVCDTVSSLTNAPHAIRAERSIKTPHVAR